MTTCSIDDCDRPHCARGMCHMHYQRWKKTGDTALRDPGSRTCEVDGCAGPYVARGMCNAHYRRWRKRGDAGGADPEWRPHGMYRTPVYITWAGMIQRCTNPANPNWPRYGGRGITVCGRWLDFTNFLADVGHRPPGMTLERINNDAGYSPQNCRWATSAEQRRNQRSPVTETCQVDGCKKPHLARGMCGMHYARWQRSRLDGHAAAQTTEGSDD